MITYHDIPEVIDGIPVFVPAQYVDDDRPTLTDPIPAYRALATPTRVGQILQALRVLGIFLAICLVTYQIAQSVHIALRDGILWESIWYLFAPWWAAGWVWGFRAWRRG